jgi:hypothetical protein
MNTRDKIRVAAADEGWTLNVLSGADQRWGADEFTRPAEPGELLAAMMAAGGATWGPADRIVVWYTALGGIERARLQTPAQQSLIHGGHSDWAALTRGPNRARQVLAWLEGRR